MSEPLFQQLIFGSLFGSISLSIDMAACLMCCFGVPESNVDKDDLERAQEEGNIEAAAAQSSPTSASLERVKASDARLNGARQSSRTSLLASYKEPDEEVVSD